MGRGDEKAADQAAVDAMRQATNGADDRRQRRDRRRRRDESAIYIGEDQHRPGQDRHRQPWRAPRLPPRAAATRWRHWQWPTPAGFSTRPTSIWKRSRSAPGCRRAWLDIDEEPGVSLKSPRPKRPTSPTSSSASSTARATPNSSPRYARRARGSLIGDGDVGDVPPRARDRDRHLHGRAARPGVLAAAALRCIGG